MSHTDAITRYDDDIEPDPESEFSARATSRVPHRQPRRLTGVRRSVSPVCLVPLVAGALVVAASTGELDVIRSMVESLEAGLESRDIVRRSNGRTGALHEFSSGCPGTHSPPSSQDGTTPLVAAAFGGHAESVEYLLAKGADIAAVNSTFRWTALIAASAKGHVDVVRLLLRHGADPNAVDSEVCAASAGLPSVGSLP